MAAPGSIIGDVALKLLGPPKEKNSNNSEWRYSGGLIIKLGTGEWYDHTAGRGGGIPQLVMRDRGGDLESANKWLLDNGFPVLSQSWNERIDKTYDYVDENGRFLFQVVRLLNPKDFRQRTRDTAGKWIWKTKDVRKVLYHLPDVIKAVADGRIIVVAEGEKDVDNLRRLNICATCNAGGAGKWRSEYNETLRGADVVVLPDNDPQSIHEKTKELRFHSDGRPVLPGQDHANEVCAHLQGIAKRVRYLMLPNLRLKGDVSDWLAAGGTAEDLQRLIESTPDWKPSAPVSQSQKPSKVTIAPEDEAELVELAGLPSGIEYKTRLKDLAKKLNVDGQTIAFEVARRRQAKPAVAPPTPPTEEELARIMDELAEKSGGLAKDKDILSKMGSQVEKSGLVGETPNAKLVYLALTSRLLDWPVSVAVKGVSGGGKSYTVEMVVGFFPSEAYIARTGMSEHTLVYSSEDFAHKTLVIYEAPGLGNAEKDEKTAYFMRSLLSERCIVYETVEKDEEGHLTSRLIRKPGPTGLITTTTATSLHPENETRMLSLNVKDTPEQTKAVMKITAKKMGSNLISDFDATTWHFLQSWLSIGERRVVVPYSGELADLIDPVAVRLRRDFRTMLMLIKAHALLHRNSRKRDDSGQIIATLADYDVIKALVGDALNESLDKKINKTVRETVQAVQVIIAKKVKSTPLLYDADGEPIDLKVSASTLEIARQLKLDKSAAKRRITKSLSDGFLHNLETRPRQPSKIILGAAMPEDAALLPSRDKLPDPETHPPFHGVGNQCTSAPVADNPINSEGLLVQTSFHQSVASAPLERTSGDQSADEGSLDTETGALARDWGNPDFTSNPIETSGETPTGALDTSIPTPERGGCVSASDGEKGSDPTEAQDVIGYPQPQRENVSRAGASNGGIPVSLPIRIIGFADQCDACFRLGNDVRRYAPGGGVPFQARCPECAAKWGAQRGQSVEALLTSDTVEGLPPANSTSIVSAGDGFGEGVI